MHSAVAPSDNISRLHFIQVSSFSSLGSFINNGNFNPSHFLWHDFGNYSTLENLNNLFPFFFFSFVSRQNSVTSLTTRILTKIIKFLFSPMLIKTSLLWEVIQPNVFLCFNFYRGTKKLILIIHQPEIQRLKFFIIHLALLFRFVYVSLWNNIRSLKIFTRRTGTGFRGRRWAERWITFVSPDSFLLLDISLVLFFYIYKTSIKWVCISFFYTHTNIR